MKLDIFSLYQIQTCGLALLWSSLYRSDNLLYLTSTVAAKDEWQGSKFLSHQLKPIVYWEGKEAFLFDQDLFLIFKF